MSETRSTELSGRPVVQVTVRDRPRWTRGKIAPHSAEVIMCRPDSPYHQLIFTPEEWRAFLADAQAGRFDLEDQPVTPDGAHETVRNGQG